MPLLTSRLLLIDFLSLHHPCDQLLAFNYLCVNGFCLPARTLTNIPFSLAVTLPEFALLHFYSNNMILFMTSEDDWMFLQGQGPTDYKQIQLATYFV